MNEAAKKWVAELRSGKWKQCRDKLIENDGEAYCCLGVANEISGLGQWDDDGHFVDNDADFDEESGRPYFEEEAASDRVKSQLGLISKFGDLILDGEDTSLLMLNDAGKSFAEIADIIEQHADQLFITETA